MKWHVLFTAHSKRELYFVCMKTLFRIMVFNTSHRNWFYRAYYVQMRHPNVFSRTLLSWHLNNKSIFPVPFPQLGLTPATLSLRPWGQDTGPQEFNYMCLLFSYQCNTIIPWAIYHSAVIVESTTRDDITVLDNCYLYLKWILYCKFKSRYLNAEKIMKYKHIKGKAAVKWISLQSV